MLILGLDCSATAASAALWRDGAVIAEYIQLEGLAHSASLLPMTELMLKNSGLTVRELDCVAVSVGPGSFTGVRIGVSTAKGLCWGAEKPAVGVSTLAAMAWNGLAAAPGEVICCCMDARRGQVYNALFEVIDGKPRRLVPDRAIAVPELARELRERGAPVLLTGDGAALCDSLLPEDVARRLAPGPMLMQSARGVCLEAAGKTPEDADRLLPVYLRLSQAERERQARLSR